MKVKVGKASSLVFPVLVPTRTISLSWQSHGGAQFVPSLEGG
jgi:hypothetical protein